MAHSFELFCVFIFLFMNHAYTASVRVFVNPQMFAVFAKIDTDIVITITLCTLTSPMLH